MYSKSLAHNLASKIQNLAPTRKQHNNASRQQNAFAFGHCICYRPIAIRLVSDPAVNFDHCLGRKDVNYTDPNLNIQLPIFSVHGNHDDPAGMGGYSVLDKLHATGLVNYFGKCTDLQDVSISPLLFEKAGFFSHTFWNTSANPEGFKNLSFPKIYWSFLLKLI